MDLPEGLDWVRGSPAGRAWLTALPTWLAECAERWSLRLGPPFRYAYASLALPADLPDGTAAVLKLQYPDEESRHEADALAHWNGDGAIRLLAHDPGRRALLVERCQPGTPLHDLPPDRALDAVIGLLPRLWRPAAAPFTPLSEEAAGWVDRMPRAWERAGQPYERRLLDAALDLLGGLASSQGEQVLVNQDLHAGNILAADGHDANRLAGNALAADGHAAGRGPWLVIDPKPLTGEREFTVVPVVRGPELGHSPAAVRHRLDRLSTELGLDRERVRGWTIGHTLAWSVADDSVFPQKIDVVRWLLDSN
ncbi:aminoglycoside phosphotransferase family protein [Micromonospora ureilytica]|uniref:aminoglycoside phosphotransferase family protein n=1 Tax=Micromonospora ureilytica TaxID=709868 RepID=UPI004039FE33